MSKLKLDAESYLKSGSNELRVLEYQTTGMSFGINILKVSKIIHELTDFTQVPESHPSVKGVFKDMNRLVPVIDLAEYLGVANETTKRNKVIVTEFFGIVTGFWVDKIDWIHHFKWEDIIDAKHVFKGINQKNVLGIVKPTEDRMVQLLDYESILLDICPFLKSSDNDKYTGKADLKNRCILVTEDSPSVRAMIVNELTELGCNVIEASDGVEGWKKFEENEVDLVICDVEMPQMDGLALTLKIRQSERSSTPVIVYSSIGDMGMKARAKFLKADAHITKLNVEKLIDTVDKLIKGEKIDQNGFEEETPVDTELETIPLD